MEPLRADRRLVHRGTELADAHLASSRSERRRGLLGRDHIEGVMVLPVRSIHTVGMRMTIDAAFCDADGVVQRVVTMAPNRIGRPCWSARSVVEAAEGSFANWGIGPGDRIELR